MPFSSSLRSVAFTTTQLPSLVHWDTIFTADLRTVSYSVSFPSVYSRDWD